MSHKALFSRTLALQGERLHFAAHSHHMWPDAVIEAHGEAALLAARSLDLKWGPVFEDLLPRLAQGVASRLGWPDPAGIVFGANTHEFLVRLCSCLPRDRPWRILSTDSEFHTAGRQFARWQEEGIAQVELVETEPFATFSERFGIALQGGGYDLVLISQVFFNSGWIVQDLPNLVAQVPDDDCIVLVDAYHGFNALPMDLSPIASRAFVTAGGYKYAMAGEGACFLACPPQRCPKPVQTGWFAGFGALASFDGEVAYAQDGSRFAGATLDPTGLFRLDAALGLLDREGLTPQVLHDLVAGLQARLLDALPSTGALSHETLMPDLSVVDRGHFLCFREPQAQDFYDRLLHQGIMSDVRRDRLRLGFAIYHDPEDVDRLVDALAQVRKSVIG